MSTYCSNCGNAIAEDRAQFCTNCGCTIVANQSGNSLNGAGTANRRARKPARVMWWAIPIAVATVAFGGFWWSGMHGWPFGRTTVSDGESSLYSYDLMPFSVGGRCGFTDQQGQFVINPQFDAARPFIAGRDYAVIVQNRKWGLIGRDGSMLIYPIYDQFEPTLDGDFFWVKAGDYWGLIDPKGAFRIPLKFSSVSQFDSSGHAVAQIDGKSGLIDDKGNFVIEPQFDEIESNLKTLTRRVEIFHEGLVPARIGTMWGYITPEGKWAINPQFEYAGHFNESGIAHAGHPAIRNEGRYATTIDKAGNPIDPGRYDLVGWFGNPPLAYVRSLTDSRWGFVDKAGKLAIPMQYSYADIFENVKGRWQASVAVEQEGKRKWGIIDGSGKLVVPPMFDEIKRFDDNGQALAITEDGFTLIDRDGKFIVPLSSTAFASLPHDGRYLFFDRPTQSTGMAAADGKKLFSIIGKSCIALDLD